jgi:hypothetical protein
MNNHSSKHFIGQQSTVETELATLAADGFARLLADTGHAPARNGDARPAADGGGGGADVGLKPTVASEWEQARQTRAQRLKLPAGYLDIPETSSSVQPDTDCLRIDGELARMCGIGFKQYALLQRYLPLHQLSRDTGKQGFTRSEFDAVLLRYGVKGCDYHNTRLLHRGNGFYWRLHGGMIYPVGYTELVKRAIQHAYDHGLHDLYLYGNHPGQRRDMYISVSGSGADFEGAVLASWYGLHGCPTISRYTLEVLLARDARSIRRMERRACIHITYNEAQTTDPAAVPLKADGTLRGDVTYSNGVWSSRLPNTYTPRMTRQHPRRGQGRKAACWFKHWLSSNRLPGDHGAEEGFIYKTLFGKLNRIGRHYCETDRDLNASRKRGNDGVLYVATLGMNRGVVWDVDALNHDICS